MLMRTAADTHPLPSGPHKHPDDGGIHQYALIPFGYGKII
jgi:hypothetical protein